jgi:hypothetical protein
MLNTLSVLIALLSAKAEIIKLTIKIIVASNYVTLHIYKGAAELKATIFNFLLKRQS